STDHRLRAFPAMPTRRESGVPDLVGSSWTGILAPAGTPPEVVNRLRSAITDALRSDDMKDKFAKLGAEARFPSQDEFASFIASEAERLGTIIRISGAKGE